METLPGGAAVFLLLVSVRKWSKGDSKGLRLKLMNICFPMTGVLWALFSISVAFVPVQSDERNVCGHRVQGPSYLLGMWCLLWWVESCL